MVTDALTLDLASLNQLFVATQDIPVSSKARLGFQIAGPGTFNFAANNLDLGVSSGIRSVGTLFNPALASVSYAGANMNLALAGDLDMTSSQIASFNGGNISVFAGGHMNIGSQDSYTGDDAPKGIYTGHGGSVTVHAVGDVNVNGSRIASYDGGDVAVTSVNGDVDAGSGQNGFFELVDVALGGGNHQALCSLLWINNHHLFAE